MFILNGFKASYYYQCGIISLAEEYAHDIINSKNKKLIHPLYQSSYEFLCFYLLGTSLLLRGRPALAKKYLEQAYALNNKDIATINNLAISYHWDGYITKSKKLFEQLLPLNDDYLDAQINYKQAHPDRITLLPLKKSRIQRKYIL